MIKKLQELRERISKDHLDLVKYVEHVINALDNVVDVHRREVAVNALAGIKPDGEREKDYYEHVQVFKKILLSELEKTIEDMEHQGDKEWDKHYKDGVFK